MKQLYKVLLVDDHPLIVEAYRRALDQVSILNEKEIEFDINMANCCDSAMAKLNESKLGLPYDIIFLDISLPPCKDGKILSGLDLGIKIREEFESIKIMVATTYNDGFMITSITKSFNPDGFMVKSDLTLSKLVQAIKTLVSGSPYYSKTVLEIMRKQFANDFYVDNIDRKILYELSKGTKMNELPNVLPLSIAALERRKRILKDIFNVSGKGDRDLLKLAQNKGFI